jgi:hypothetical protein
MTLGKMQEHIKLKILGLVEIFLVEPNNIISEDRTLLEKEILPYFSRSERYQKILFVGCSAYTRSYEQIFSPKEYWTIDYKHIKRKYGSGKHVVDSVVNLGQHFSKDYFDLIIMNGVIGFGLNQPSAIENALDACFQRLAVGGVLVLGWNDDPPRMPIALEALQTLKKFQEHYFPPLQSAHVRTAGEHRHVYSFYRKDS